MGFGGVHELPEIVCKLWCELSVECYVASLDFEKSLCPSKCGIALKSWQLLLWATPDVTRVHKLFVGSDVSVVEQPWVVGDALTPGSPTWKVTRPSFHFPGPCLTAGEACLQPSPSSGTAWASHNQGSPPASPREGKRGRGSHTLGLVTAPITLQCPLTPYNR